VRPSARKRALCERGFALVRRGTWTGYRGRKNKKAMEANDPGGLGCVLAGRLLGMAMSD